MASVISREVAVLALALTAGVLLGVMCDAAGGWAAALAHHAPVVVSVRFLR